VDYKLYQIVKRIISQKYSNLIDPTSSGSDIHDAIQSTTHTIIDLHREYQRKEINWVTQHVHLAFYHILENNSKFGASSSNNSSSNGNDANNSSRKRGRAVVPIGGGSTTTLTTLNNNNHDNNKDKEIIVRSPSRSIITNSDNNIDTIDTSSNGNHGSGGMLNATLRNRYRDIQREREKMEAETTTSNADKEVEEEYNNNNSAAAAEKNCSSIPPPCNDDDDDDETNNLLNTSSSLPTTPKTTTTATTPTQRSNTKKSTKKKGTKRKNSNTTTTPLKTSSSSSSSRIMSNDGMIIQPSTRPTERYSNLGGITPLVTQLRELIEYPLSHPELFIHLGIDPPRGVLLRGPPGCGKTHLARAIAGELNVTYYQVSAPELVGGVSGESESRIRSLFDSARCNAPSIIFIDEIDSIAPKRGSGSGGGGGSGRGMEQRIVAQLLTSLDSIHPKNTNNGAAVLVLGATNRPDAIDPALRRAGRFDREIVLGPPDELAREGILRAMTCTIRVNDDVDYALLAKKTPGFVGADIRSLLKEAAVIAINRIFRTDLLGGSGGGSNSAVGGGGDDDDSLIMDCIDNGGNANNVIDNDDGNNNSNNNVDAMSLMRHDVQSIIPLTQEQLEPLYVTMSDFLLAIPQVQPSAKREGFATVPDVSWSDIGALVNIREELTLSVLEPISHPERFEALGLPLPAGVLLYGPPGCGKVCRINQILSN
jgi:ribosome biogenesis ATPase